MLGTIYRRLKRTIMALFGLRPNIAQIGDFDIFFDVLETLENNAYAAAGGGFPTNRRTLQNSVINQLQVGAAQGLRNMSNARAVQWPLRGYIRIPFMPNANTLAAFHVTVLSKRPFKFQLEVILARSGHDAFAIRFDHPHYRGQPFEHDYFHIQFADSLGPRNIAQRPHGLMAGLAGSYPATPVPARNAIELLISVLLALYGHNGMLAKLNGLPAVSKPRARRAQINILDRCTP